MLWLDKLKKSVSDMWRSPLVYGYRFLLPLESSKLNTFRVKITKKDKKTFTINYPFTVLFITSTFPTELSQITWYTVLLSQMPKTATREISRTCGIVTASIFWKLPLHV